MCFTSHPIWRSNFYGVKWRVRSASTEKNQALRYAAEISKVKNNYIDLEKQIVQWLFYPRLSKLQLLASVEGQPGYRATHIQVFPYPSVPPYTFGDSFAAPTGRKKKQNPKCRM